MLLVAVTQLLSAKDYHILSEGTEQVLRLQGDGAVVEVGADGKAGELLLMETRVVLRA